MTPDEIDDGYYRCLHCNGILWFMYFGEESWLHDENKDFDHKAEPKKDYHV